jgi:hypothetical protein
MDAVQWGRYSVGTGMEKEGMERTEKEKWFNYARGLGGFELSG